MEKIGDKIKTLRKTKAAGQLPSIELGKLPPQAIDLEEAVLGALMLEKDALNDVIEILKPESFYKHEHQKIYTAIVNLFNATQPVDILTVTQELKKKGELELVGGPYYITKLTNRVASSANAEFHARIIAQKFIQRELIRVSGEIYNNAFEDTTDVFDLLDKAETELFGIAEGNIRKNYDQMSSLLYDAVKEIEKAKNNDGHLTGVPSGFTALDRVTAGWQKSDLIIIAARPGMGKTAFVLSMARNIAVDFKKPIALFSLEMSSLQLVNRLISSETELPADKLRRGQLEEHEWQQLQSKITPLADAPLFIDDTPALSVFELRAKCRRLKAQHDVSMIIIDYLQLMQSGSESKNGNREQEISMISRSLKSIAKELEIPVIALSQLSRQVETRSGDKRPQLSDLRESGAIEQDADIVLFLYRPEYYKMETFINGDPAAGQGEVIIAKHRNGSLEDVRLKFIGRLAKFTNNDDMESFNPQAGISNSTDFIAPTTTKPSRMNSIEEDDNLSPF
ncbi:MAG: Replicative DNA helicase [Bacteroidia bacterium]|nr:Replicative DNA helicase [Bacteroidia bacterium]